MIAAGFPVIIDAAFVLHAERANFGALAREMGVPFVIASLHTDAALLAERLALRSRRGGDPSEADFAVMRKVQVVQQPLRNEELGSAVTFINNGDMAALRSADEAWQLLDARLS